MGTQDETMDTRFSILVAAVSRPTLPRFFQPAARTDYFRSQFRPIMTSRPRRPRVFQNWQAGRHLGVPLLSKSRYTVSNGNSNRDSAAGSYTPPTPTHFHQTSTSISTPVTSTCIPTETCFPHHSLRSPPPPASRSTPPSRRPPRKTRSPGGDSTLRSSPGREERISRRICSCLGPGLHLSLLQSLYCAGLRAFWGWVAREARRAFGTQGQGRWVAHSLRVTELGTGISTPTTIPSCSFPARSPSSQTRIRTTSRQSPPSPSPPFPLPPLPSDRDDDA
ncbi:hypothetical protein C8F01DRAFT_1152293 [Mycena amicta]|nr:hypothetical protein C8F01DRAFT_1152293 [Mycena amicta]